MNDLIFSHERNIFLAKLLWISLGIATVVDLLSGVSLSVIVWLWVIGGGISLGITLLNAKKLLTPYIKYIVVFGMAVLSFLLVASVPKTSTYLVVYYSLALVALYQDYRPLVLSGVLGLVLTNVFYFRFGEEMFPDATTMTLIAYNNFLLLVSGVLILQSRFGERVQKRLIEMEKKEAIKEQMEQALLDAEETVQGLSWFSNNLKENIEETRRISGDLTKSFHEIAEGMTNQAGSLSDITQSVLSVDQQISTLADAATQMRESSDNSLELTDQGHSQAKNLSGEMEMVRRVIGSTVELMETLNNQTNQISMILNSLNSIAKQTNLLALNASIEASRAGEAGRGFAVVAAEVRKLSEISRNSVQQTADILQEIRTKVTEVAEQVNLGHQEIETSIAAMVNVESVFSRLAEDAQNAVERADRLEQLTKVLEENSHIITDKAQTIAAVTQESTASIEEVSAGIQEQDHRIDCIAEGFIGLEQAVEQLQQLKKAVGGATE